MGPRGEGGGGVRPGRGGGGGGEVRAGGGGGGGVTAHTINTTYI